MFFYQLFYYSFARFLPKSTMPVFGEVRLAAQALGMQAVVLERSGKDFTVGSHVGLGKNFKSLNRIVTIDDYLMMGEDVLFLGGITMNGPVFLLYSRAINKQWNDKTANHQELQICCQPVF